MPEQVNLTDYSLVITAVPQQTKSDRDWNPDELTAVIVKLEPSVYGCCSLCLRRGELGFCLKYLDSEGNMVLWAPICRNCAGDIQNRQR